ncbi:TRAP transporter small permease [Consotaella salsifontis]|uniref:TRAP transporter small permease protein n=1 Tax=Consotaella salsifontis TaxID=1365950 RepID=A0A1T4S5T2_9HYPH|nr:TRAP transporter small permease [Consotaella salsifontis]SKA23680.1 gluconokinase [Consotaella salsifontis]
MGRLLLLRLWKFLDEVLPALLVAFTIVMVSADVLLRNAFGRTVPYGIELSTYAFVWMIFLGSAGAARRGRHFHVDILHQKLGARVRLALQVVLDLACVVIAAVMTDISWDYTMRSWNRTSEGLQMPLGYFYMIFPLSFALMALSYLTRMVGLLRSGPADE